MRLSLLNSDRKEEDPVFPQSPPLVLSSYFLGNNF